MGKQVMSGSRKYLGARMQVPAHRTSRIRVENLADQTATENAHRPNVGCRNAPGPGCKLFDGPAGTSLGAHPDHFHVFNSQHNVAARGPRHTAYAASCVLHPS